MRMTIPNEDEIQRVKEKAEMVFDDSMDPEEEEQKVVQTHGTEFSSSEFNFKPSSNIKHFGGG